MKFDFLNSPRFWKLFLVGLAAGIEEFNRTHIWEQALLVGITIWLGGSVGVGTLDRATEVLSNRSLPVNEPEETVAPNA